MKTNIVLTLVVASVLVGGGAAMSAAQEPSAGTPQRGALAPLAARLEKERDNAELQRVAPFKVFDNLYYIGVGWVGSWLLTTSDGLIVIDTLEERYVDHLIDGIRTLGFNPADIKHVIVLQAHFDHFGGAARIQEMYGASVWMGEEDWNMLARPPVGRGGASVRVPRRDRVVKDGDELTLGDTTLKLYSTPGHTPGTTSIDMTVYDEGRAYRAFFFGGAAPAAGAAAAKQFLQTVKRLQGMQQGVQVRLVNHPFSDPEFWDRVDRLARRKPSEPHPFVTPDVFPDWLKQLEARATQQIEAAQR